MVFTMNLTVFEVGPMARAAFFFLQGMQKMQRVLIGSVGTHMRSTWFCTEHIRVSSVFFWV